MEIMYDEQGVQYHRGYLALPPDSYGVGLLLLHDWWGLTSLFVKLADKLAAEGFVVFAPDLFGGAKAADLAEADKLTQAARMDFIPSRSAAKGAVAFLQNHSAVADGKLASVGFSFGTAFALGLDQDQPDAFYKVVLFSSLDNVEVGESKAAYLAHFAEKGPFEEIEAARGINAANLERHIYPGTRHWFFDENQPDYNIEATQLAWERTLAFLALDYLPPHLLQSLSR